MEHGRPQRRRLGADALRGRPGHVHHARRVHLAGLPPRRIDEHYVESRPRLKRVQGDARLLIRVHDQAPLRPAAQGQTPRVHRPLGARLPRQLLQQDHPRALAALQAHRHEPRPRLLCDQDPLYFVCLAVDARHQGGRHRLRPPARARARNARAIGLARPHAPAPAPRFGHRAAAAAPGAHHWDPAVPRLRRRLPARPRRAAAGRVRGARDGCRAFSP
mmetsp:Transcript_15787/g.55099  ORF Transcript_15787/g.55099 Transcript_15787/m.55099 type:complete len:218 (-) Transcript_15787:759-1412(-)